MKALGREISFAMLAWLVPFVTSVCIFPLKRSYPGSFESLMGITLVGSTVLLGCIYLRGRTEKLVLVSIGSGVKWMAANWAMDALMFSSGPMKMSFHQYLTQIAGAYVMIPIITCGLGIAASRAARAAAWHEGRVVS
jgi:hypothetical protein